MPIKRRLNKCREYRVTREAVEAFHAGDAVTLHRALGLKPWQPSPLEADTPNPPDWASGPWAEAWPIAHELRGKMEAVTPSG